MRNNGLSIVLLALFLACWGRAGRCWPCRVQQRSERAPSADRDSIRLPGKQSFLGSDAREVGERITADGCVRPSDDRAVPAGSAESKRVGVREPVDIDARQVSVSDPPWPVRRGGLVLRLYENSLGLVLAILFMASILGHAIAGVRLFNENLVAHRQPPVTLVEYATGGEFWFQSMQNWQSEFLSIGQWSC
jgi:hypothetical protein